MYLDYYVTNILDINPIYDTEFETDHLMTHDEFISEIQNIVISQKQYERLNNALKHTRDKIEKARKEALLMPTFTSKDFHAVDKFVMEISMFLSSYSWLNEEIFKPEISDKLKNKLIRILNIAEENIFPNNFLDKVRQWYNRRKLFNSKDRYKKYKKTNGDFEKDILPF
jgi:deoxyhypusine synthase